MYANADKKQQNKNKSTVDILSQKHDRDEVTQRLVDNRPEAIQMQRLQGMANNHTKANTFQFVDNRPEGTTQRKLQEGTDNNIQLKGVIQRKTDHLFNDIPKTLRGLPATFQRPGLDSIRQQLDTIRNKSGNKKDDVHASGGADANSLRYGMASSYFVKAVDDYGKGEINEGKLRIANYTLWKESLDDDVVSSLGPSVRSDIESWKALEKPTYEQLAKHF